MGCIDKKQPRGRRNSCPLPAELVTLYQAAQIGDIAGIEKEVTRLRQLAPQYVAFTYQ